jgi:uncharacterized protein
MAEQKQDAPAAPEIADPAALGLGGFALTTFVLSAHLAGWAPDVIWVGLAFFYGGLAQFMAGMWEFRRGNTFAATAFGSYGAFWMSLALYVVLVLFGKVPPATVSQGQGWFLAGFAVFNTYMMLWALRVNIGVFLVFLTLEATEILLAIGNLTGATGFIQIGGIVGVVTAIVAWYVSAATVVNSLGSRPFLPLGKPIWSEGSGDGAAAQRVSPAG